MIDDKIYCVYNVLDEVKVCEYVWLGGFFVDLVV